MTQSQVICFLRKNQPKKFTSKQIAEEIDVSYSSVATSTRKIRASNLFPFIKSKYDKKQYTILFWYKENK